jgi:hypothetical protein
MNQTKNKAKIVKDPDSESGLSIVFPENIMEELKWKVGDDLIMELDKSGKILVSKKE